IQQLEGDAFTEALSRDQDLFRPKEFRQREDGHRAADDRIGPFRAESGNLVASLLFGASQRVDDFSEAVDRQLVPMKPTDGIPASLTIDLGEISQRSAGTHEPVAGTKTADLRLGQMVSDVIAQATELLGRRRIGVEKLLTQSKGSERQAHG